MFNSPRQCGAILDDIDVGICKTTGKHMVCDYDCDIILEFMQHHKCKLSSALDFRVQTIDRHISVLA